MMCVVYYKIMLAWFAAVSFITVYTVKQTGLTCGGPQKCASISQAVPYRQYNTRHNFM